MQSGTNLSLPLSLPFFLVNCLRSVTSGPSIICLSLLSSSSSSAHWLWTILTKEGVSYLFEKNICNENMKPLKLCYCVCISNCFLCPDLRLVLEFNLFFYAFGKLGTVIWAWLIMFGYTLLGPYYVLSHWLDLYHRTKWKISILVATAVTVLATQMSLLGYFPIYVVLHYQLPPASRFIIILEQVPNIT